MRGSRDSLASSVAAAALDRPEAAAVRDASGTTTYARLAELVGSARAALEVQVPAGGTFGIDMAASARSVAALLACEAAERPVVLLPPGLRTPEHREVIETSGLSLLWSADAAWTRLAPVHRSGRAPLPPGIIQLTSGSLGPSHLALRTWDAVRVEVDSLVTRLKLTADERVLCASSIAHSYGLIGGLLAPLSVGAAVTLSSPDIADVEELSPSMLFGLGRTYLSLLSLGETPSLLRRTRLALSAGAPLPEGLFGAFLERTGVPIRQDYGTTETGTISIDDDPQVRAGTVGCPLEHVQVRIGGTFDGDGGEIQVRSHAIASGYLRDGELTPCVDASGWYHTRDTGSFTGAFLRVGPRIRSPVDIPGGSVAPGDIEEAISRHPGIREVLVLPLREGRTAGIRAVVATDLDGEVVRAYCSSVLPAHMRPSRLEIVDALPRSPAGKVLQKYLV